AVGSPGLTGIRRQSRRSPRLASGMNRKAKKTPLARGLVLLRSDFLFLLLVYFFSGPVSGTCVPSMLHVIRFSLPVIPRCSSPPFEAHLPGRLNHHHKPVGQA